MSTATYDSVSFDITQDGSTVAAYFRADGLKFYVTGNLNDTIYQYSMSSAWDLSTASYDSVSYSVTAQASSPIGVWFKDDGTKMFVLEPGTTGKLFQYSLSTAWDVSTATYDSVSADIEGGTGGTGLFIRDDGEKLYTVSNATDRVYQYSMAAAGGWTTGMIRIA